MMNCSIVSISSASQWGSVNVIQSIANPRSQQFPILIVSDRQTQSAGNLPPYLQLHKLEAVSVSITQL